MANDRHKQTRPAGDENLTGQRDMEDVNIRDGGVGPSGTSVNATGRIGGLGNTSDGMHMRRDGDPSIGGDHTMDGSNIIDTNLTDSGVNPYGAGSTEDRDGE